MPKPAYPQQADKKIREWAGKPLMPDDIAHEAIKTLDKIQHYLFGDADKVQETARDWANDTTITQVAGKLDNTDRDVSSYWEGPAASAYKSYSHQLQNTISSNDKVFDTLGNSLQKCAGKVQDTYKILISFIGKIAGKLSRIAVDVPLLLVPGLDILQLSSMVDDAKSVLEEFITGAAKAINSAIDVIKGYNNEITRMITEAGNFELPPEPAEPATHAGNRHVRQND